MHPSSLAAVPLLVAAAALLLVTNTLVSVARRRFWFRRARLPLAPTPFALVVNEALAVVVVLAWRVLRRGRNNNAAGNGPVVVFVHGMWADSTSMWGHRSALIERGRATVAPDLGARGGGLGAWADDLGAAIGACEGHIDIVCHSLGGIALRVCLANKPWLRAKIRRVVLLAVPEHGTGAAVGVPFAVMRDLAPGSPFLASLPPIEALLPSARTTRIWSRHDPIVYPVDIADHVLEGVGHAELLTRPGVHSLVVDAIDQA